MSSILLWTTRIITLWITCGLSGFASVFKLETFCSFLNQVICNPSIGMIKTAITSSVSIVVPARDEEGTIELLLKRIPKIGAFTEIIFVEGRSADKTWEEIMKFKSKSEKFKDRQKIKIQAYQQTGIGKADAVDLVFQKLGEIY